MGKPWWVIAFLALSACHACGEAHPVAYSTNTTDHLERPFPAESRLRLDLLWVIGNSDGMWPAQQDLRQSFELFATALDSKRFQIAVTTTAPRSPGEEPGTLSRGPTTPHPGALFHLATAADGSTVEGDYAPIREMIGAAVACMQTPDGSFNAVSNAEIECALYGEPEDCAIERAGCGTTRACGVADLFPAPDAYRRLPPVLRSDDYRTGASLDVERLSRDFACLSLVGTNGASAEQGIAAATAAVRRDMTGGTEAATNVDPNAPNHGLVRSNADFAVVFVTNNNDCSHDGTLDTGGACGLDVCEFANRKGATSALLDVETLQQALLDGLHETKEEPAFGVAEVFAASLHANPRRFDGEVPSDAQCAAADYTPIGPVCGSALGLGFSGDRYERLLRTFPYGQYFPAPNPNAPSNALQGWFCSGMLAPGMEALGKWLGPPPPSRCIAETFYPCASDSECPANPEDGSRGRCRPVPGGAENYCDSALHLIARAHSEPWIQRLADSGVCVGGPGAVAAFGNACLVRSDLYAVERCETDAPGLSVRLLLPLVDAREAFAGSELSIWLTLREPRAGTPVEFLSTR